jgi:hypothetical protein
MKSGLKIKWSEEAINNLDNIIAWAKKRIHRCVFTKNLTIYYKVNENNLELLSIFDTRQHSSKARI